MTSGADDLPTPGPLRFRGSDRESRPARPSGAVARIARPLARFARAQAGRAWQAVRADLESRLQSLPVSRFLRQRVRRMLLRALA
jgi:hypothetical protein